MAKARAQEEAFEFPSEGKPPRYRKGGAVGAGVALPAPEGDPERSCGQLWGQVECSRLSGEKNAPDGFTDKPMVTAAYRPRGADPMKVV